MSEAKHYTRPHLERRRPDRSRGNLYRTPDHERTGLGGVPLSTAEDAMVAAVRMAYDIADSQIARSKKLADRLKGAADRATGNDPDGERSAEDAADAAGRLVNNAALSVMAWFEALMAAESGLAPRLATAQVRAARTVLFGRRDEGERAPEPAPREAPSGGTYAPEPAPARVRVKLPASGRRAVRVARWEVDRVFEAPLAFRCIDVATRLMVEAELSPADPGDDRPILAVTSTPLDAPSGLWRAPLCDADGEQHGIIEIEL